jgi:hypothetical protein
MTNDKDVIAAWHHLCWSPQMGGRDCANICLPVVMGSSLWLEMLCLLGLIYRQAPLFFFLGVQLHRLRAHVYFCLKMGRNV